MAENCEKPILGAIRRLCFRPGFTFAQKILLLFDGSLVRSNVMKHRNCAVNGPLLIP